eukprot:m.35673 g.35673  ORF g.35673 m.35673 type:complete len:76 (+) comp10034_c0_seq1:465-692(+)
MLLFFVDIIFLNVQIHNECSSTPSVQRLLLFKYLLHNIQCNYMAHVSTPKQHNPLPHDSNIINIEREFIVEVRRG